MPVFEHSFIVKHPLAAVAEFHHNPMALKRLNPPGVRVQFHQLEALGEGSIVEFSLWFGPFPIRWRARHQNVNFLQGFTDVQEVGPLKTWEHTHAIEALGENTRVSDRVRYQFQPGWRRFWTRIMFSWIGLKALFAYRAFATRRAVSAVKSQKTAG